MSFFKRLFGGLLVAAARPTPPATTVGYPAGNVEFQSPVAALRETLEGTARGFATSVIQSYLTKAIEGLGDKETQLDAVESLQSFLDNYSDFLIDSIAMDALKAAEAETETELARRNQ